MKMPRKVLVLGAGALKIGQSGEFDYSGSQALKALREEGISTVLVNPNIATIQTSKLLANPVYFLPITPFFVEKIIEKERPDGILLSFGGQTALNCGVELFHAGILEKYNVQILGTPISAIILTEDRQAFARHLQSTGIPAPQSRSAESPEEAMRIGAEIGFPVMLRAGFALGGQGSGIARDIEDLERIVRGALAFAPQVLVEQYLHHYKEVEYEVVRDAYDNCITVCNMENMDPLGIHTGESIVLAPSQTLNNAEYHSLRAAAITIVRSLGIVGECNVQFAINPRTSAYYVIEVNARLSRSSALASKATGYPLAYVAAKLALGYALPDIPNSITRRTTAFFEPALDYLVCKVPRWDLSKFYGASMRIGTEMKSVGEVMAIGRTFPEVIQKALRMLDIAVSGLEPLAFEFDDLRDALRNPTPLRIFAVARALWEGLSIDEIRELTAIDRWFLHSTQLIVDMHRRLTGFGSPPTGELLREAKSLGFSDHAIEKLVRAPAGSIRELRKVHHVSPHFAQIDTLAAEFPAETNYLYMTYHACQHDVAPSWRKKIMVLGSGVYRIGSSVEFDWCCVNAAQAATALGYETLMVNCNPETVSTDYDVCDRLIFDEISLETVLDLYEHERPYGVLVSMGGQIPNNLAIPLHRAGVKILGTDPENIDKAEDRRKFSALLDQLGIDQPRWCHITDAGEAEQMVDRLGGFPVLVRPSYVLSGAAMSVAHEPNELRRILARASSVSPDHPVVMSKFESHAREVEIDAVAHEGEIVLWAISEHIEDAGIHSGDATLVLPPQTLYIATIRRIKRIAAKLARALSITGPFNVQFLAKHNAVKVIECNLRASRSLPFVSKVTGKNFAREAMRCMLGVAQEQTNNSLDLDFVGVKVPMFSFSRLVGADPMLGVEMMSTGEVGCLGADLNEALLHGLLATGFRVPRKGVLLSLGPIADKYWFADEVRVISHELKLPIYATAGTAEMLAEIDIPCTPVGKKSGDGLSGLEVIDDGRVDFEIEIDVGRLGTTESRWGVSAYRP